MTDTAPRSDALIFLVSLAIRQPRQTGSLNMMEEEKS